MAQIAIDRLVARGHRRIAVTRPHDDANLGYVFVDRCREALAAHGLPLEEELIFRSTPNETGGYQIARELLALKDRPTAALLVNETIAIGFYQGLSEAGVRPGRDIAVIGRYSAHAHFLSPPLTCFRLSLRDLGIALAETLLSTMPAFKDHYPQALVNAVWPMELVEGESDGFLVNGDESRG